MPLVAEVTAAVYVVIVDVERQAVTAVIVCQCIKISG